MRASVPADSQPATPWPRLRCLPDASLARLLSSSLQPPPGAVGEGQEDARTTLLARRRQSGCKLKQSRAKIACRILSVVAVTVQVDAAPMQLNRGGVGVHSCII